MKKLLILLLTLGILGFGGYVYYKEGTLPVNKKSSETQIFIIKKGDSLNEISKNLEKEELIRNKLVFYIVVKQLGIEKSIQAGDFRLSQSMDVYELSETLTHGTLDIWVTIIEGLRKEEIADIVSKNFNIPAIEFIKAANEGYLFPDTYLIPREATTENILAILTNTFNNKYSDKIKEKASKLSLTQKDVIILASLIEREALYANDRQKVANVLLKRIEKGFPLEIDATVQYALGYQPKEKSWWKKHLTQKDLDTDSEYNTRKYTGLPPEPICSPGLASIEAVVNATTDTPYLFYVSDINGKLHYAITLEEHNENIKKYLQ